MLDPLIRLTAQQLPELQQVHLYSELDEDQPAGPTGGRDLTGYTEWATRDRQPAISFAWDWTYDDATRCLLAHWSSLRTNLCVVDASGEDLGDEATRLWVARLMTRACWEHVVADALGLQLAAPPDYRH